jgi:hypothetical protein
LGCNLGIIRKSRPENRIQTSHKKFGSPPPSPTEVDQGSGRAIRIRVDLDRKFVSLS